MLARLQRRLHYGPAFPSARGGQADGCCIPRPCPRPRIQASYFNLVFESNKASLALWESLGFERVATLPQAARLEGVQGLDTAYGYHYNLAELPEDFEPAAVAEGRVEAPTSTRISSYNT